MAVPYRSFIFAALACVAVAGPPDQPIQAEVQHAQVAAPGTEAAPAYRVSFEGGIHAVPTEAKPLVTFKLTFDVLFTNQSDHSVDIPDPDGGLDGVAWISLYTLQSQQADGSWKYLVPGGMLAWVNAKFAACKPLRPQEKVAVKNVPGRLSLEPSVASGLGPKVTVRAGFLLSCKGQGEGASAKTVVADPFVLSISEPQ